MTDLGVGLDTSVLVRLLTGQPVELATAATAFLDEMETKGSPVLRFEGETIKLSLASP